MPDAQKASPLSAATFGPFVARVRAERGLTQRELAERLYVSDKTVSKWERGLSLPSVPLLVPLAEALGLSISELMSCEESPGQGAWSGPTPTASSPPRSASRALCSPGARGLCGLPPF